ncbi:MAG: RNA-directed DNA polymerase [Planctomycetes bacterium]|nr:RNA-directed DNA polymerase [Planctomycetota bacterium]
MSYRHLLKPGARRAEALVDVDGLARACGQDATRLRRLRENLPSAYGRIERPKPKGGFRIIRPPRQDLKEVQRGLLDWLETRFTAKPWMHGGVAQRSIISHAQPHCGKAMVAVLDVRDFFGSVRRERLAALLTAAGLEGEALETLLDLVTLDDTLPQGAPTSCLLANLAFFPADQRFRRVSAKRGLVYTRYLDDLALSGDEDFKELRGPLVEALTLEGFQVAAEKVAFMGRHEPQVVTGLVVNDRLRPTRAFREALIAEINDCQIEGLGARSDRLGTNPQRLRARLLGQIRHLARFDPAPARRLERRLRSAPGGRATQSSRARRRTSKASSSSSAYLAQESSEPPSRRA